LLAWGKTTFGLSGFAAKDDLVGSALKLLAARPLVIVIDGLEVLQEGPDDGRHGSFLDGSLREFLARCCQQTHATLVVLTSRFVFADLERYLGTAFHQLELHGLPDEQGAGLLVELGVHGSLAERSAVNSRLEGHPLGLRVFAQVVPPRERDTPQRFVDHTFRTTALPLKFSLNDKLRRLLDFYEKKLPPLQARLLGVIALFRSPVSDLVLFRLARCLYRKKRERLPPDDATLAPELYRLQAHGIITREPTEHGPGSACHPILRDHFRAVLLGTGIATARRAADLLQVQPSGESPQSFLELEPVILAIELLLEVGDFSTADKLYEGRLRKGQVFLRVPAIREGFACATGFVRTEERRRACETLLSARKLQFYLTQAGRFAGLSGYYEGAISYNADAVELAKASHDSGSLRRSLLEESTLRVILGRLTDAQRFADASGDVGRMSTSQQATGQAWRCWSRVLCGDLKNAATAYFMADALGEGDGRDHEERCGREIRLAEFLVRTDQPQVAIQRLRPILAICERHDLNAYAAWCRWLLSQCALDRLDAFRAKSELSQASPVLRKGQLLFWFARLNVTMGYWHLLNEDASNATTCAEESLSLAGPRAMRLVHADALVLRGRARLFAAKPGYGIRALDDVSEALRIARECGYVWAERDALDLQAKVQGAFGNRHITEGLLTEARHFASRLKLTDADLAEAEAQAHALLSAPEKRSTSWTDRSPGSTVRA
jgi:tetratricopeptide (TPR) repeat protein